MSRNDSRTGQPIYVIFSQLRFSSVTTLLSRIIFSKSSPKNLEKREHKVDSFPLSTPKPTWLYAVGQDNWLRIFSII